MKRCLAISHWLLLIAGLAFGVSGQAQMGIDASAINAKFKAAEVEFQHNEIVSNPLKVVNNATRSVSFTIDASLPPAWGSLGMANRIYTIAAGDSIFIPFRVIPKGNLVGNTKYAINIMMRTEDGLPLAHAAFYCFTKKVVKWEMSVLPEDKIYFRNGDDISRFSLSMLNTGNYEQDFQVTLHGGQREDLLLLDTFDNIVRAPSYTISLDAGQDTSLTFKVKPTQFKRNSRTVSLTNHRPLNQMEEQRFRFYAQSEEAKQIGHQHMKKGTKVDFIKLANTKTVTPYRSDYLPLVAEAQIQNILSDYSFMSLNLRGVKQFDQNRRLMYFTQLYYSQTRFNTTQFNNLPWYIGYFDKKWDVQIGQVNGRSMGVLSSGKGIAGSYLFHRNHRVGAHFTQSPGLANRARTTSMGVYYDYIGPGRVRVSSTLARSNDEWQGIAANVGSTRVNYRIFSGHNLSLLGALSLRDYADTTIRQWGYMAGVTYSGIMVSKRLRTTINARHNSHDFGITTSERSALTNRTTFDLRPNVQLQLLNNIMKIRRFTDRLSDSVQYDFSTFFNRFNASFRSELGTFQPGVFYDIIEQIAYTNHYRGVAFTYSNYDFRRNALYTTSVKMGYNNPLEYPEIKEYFTANISLLARIKTVTVNMRYGYGPTNPLVLLSPISGGTYPQMFRASVQHQHLFRNTHFILQSGMNYSYSNQINSHNLSLFPELFFFTSTGWRFSVNASYAFTSSNFQKATNNLNATRRIENPNPEATISNSVRFGATIRKEFGIPVPFAKTKNFNLDFIAFFDLNGNGVWDRDEPTIENVVVRLDNEEVITNSQGRASIKNMPEGVYYFTPFPLDAPVGWFAEIPDSLFVREDATVFIPFVRGIKVMGQVVMDRDQLVTGNDDRIDLSNIKITAASNKAYHTLTGFDGSFELYLPNGTYTLSMDENVLSDRFRLLQNNIPVTLDQDVENIYVTFFVIEKRRKVNVKKF